MKLSSEQWAVEAREKSHNEKRDCDYTQSTQFKIRNLNVVRRNNINKRRIIKQLEMVVLTLKRANKDYSKWEDKRTPYGVACWAEQIAIIDQLSDCIVRWIVVIVLVHTIKRQNVSVWLAIKPI